MPVLQEHTESHASKAAPDEVYAPTINIDPPSAGERCEWDEGICLAPPTHRIVRECSDGGDHDHHTYDFCGKHYAAWLAEYALVQNEILYCPCKNHKDDITYYGTIADYEN